MARHLADRPVDLTLVDRNNFHTFQPLLYQVATAGLNAADVAHVVRGPVPRAAQPALPPGHGHRRRLGRPRRSLLDGQPPLPFDHLVLAGGAAVTHFGTPGAAEHGFALYTLADAVQLRNHVVERFEGAADRAAAGEPPDDGAPHLRGGRRRARPAWRPPARWPSCSRMVFRKDYPELDVSRARIVLVELQDHLLGPFSPRSRRHALDTLRSRGVDVRLGTGGGRGRRRPRSPSPTARCCRATRSCGRPACGPTRSPTCSASSRAAAAASWSAPTSASRAGTTSGRSATSRPPPTRRASVLPQLAPVAMQAGRHVARQIGRLAEGKPTEPFRYRDKGTMATIGRRAAVAELPGRHPPQGGPAWLAWLGLHLVFLVGKRNRASVLLNWAWNYLTWDRGPRLLLRPDVEPST